MDEDLLEQIAEAIRDIVSVLGGENSDEFKIAVTLASLEELLRALPVPCQIAHKEGQFCRHDSCIQAYREEGS